jgi:tetratricopeptide (TPR) repeat protein
MKHISILVLNILIVFSLFSQNALTPNPETLIKEADSLLKKNDRKSIALAKTVFESFGEVDEYFIKSTLISGIAFKNLGNYDSSLFYINIGLKRAIKIRDTIDLIKSYSSRGVVQYLRADYSGAINDFRKAVGYHEAFGYEKSIENLSPLRYAKTLNNLASVYIKTGQSDSALTYFIKSLEIREKNKAPKRMLIVGKLNVGSIYLAMEDYDNSEKWIKKVLECTKEINDSGLMGKCYMNLGIISKKTGDTINAIKNYKNSLAISEDLGNKRDQAIVLQNLALLCQSQGKYAEAYAYSNRALAINRDLKANNSVVHIGLCNLFMEQHIYDSTIFHGKLAIEQAKNGGNINSQIEGYYLLYKAYKRKKEFSEALGAYETYFVLQDSVLDKENQEYIQNLKAEFETERKEGEIEFLRKLNESEGKKARAIQGRQKMIIVTALLGVVLFIVISVLVVIKRKKDKELYLVEKKLLETDLKNKELASKKLQTEIVFKTKQLTTHALNMMQKNQILTGLREKLQAISKKVRDDLAMDFKSVIRDINHIQKTEKDWELFKKYFESVNRDFNNKLRNINSGLSTNEYRLAALISLNLNIKETAAVLNITPNSVKLARHRLRKKLGLETGEDLYAFLNKL